MIDVLVLCDDQWHSAEVIELGIAPLRSKYNLTLVRSAKDILTPEWIAKYPLIMNCKMNQLNASNPNPWFDENVTEVGPKEFEEYVRSGGGFLSVHAGNTSRSREAYTNFIGNYFVGHPPRCRVQVKMTSDHPITNGVEDFEIRDEHYNICVTAQDAHIFCRTSSETGGDQVGGYTRTLEKGRMCVLTPGHILSVWEHENFQKLLNNAIEWCLGMDS